MRRDSWRSVPTMWRPPASRTSSPSFLQLSSYFSTTLRELLGLGVGSRPCSLNSSFASISGLPPRMMSVPRPAMFVETVIAPFATCLRDDVRLFLVLLRVEDGVRDPLLLQDLRDRGALLDAGRADENRAALLVGVDDLVHDRGELLALRLVDEVLVVGALDRLVRRDRDDVRACTSCGTLRPRCRPFRSCRRASCRGGRGSGT